MPTLSRWSIRLALINLVVGWAIGALLMLNKAWALSGAIWHLIGLHIALVLFGWTLQLVIGVAYWILPTFGDRSNRGREAAAWLSVGAVNAGVLWAFVALFWHGASPLVSATLWFVAAVAFGVHAWPRVKAFGG